jgi:hypothetical protein
LFAKIGAISYALWGLVHIGAAVQGVRLARSVETGVVRSRLMQNAWNLGCSAVAAVFIALAFNWSNSQEGYWINLALISAVDIGFVVLIAWPGQIDRRSAITGPALWLTGVLFSTLGSLLERP